MKTAEDKLRHVKEAADEKWHEIVDTGTGLIFGPGYVPPTCSCGGNPSTMSRNHDNPSPTDMTELFRLARKTTDLGCVLFTFEGDIGDTAVICWLACNGKDYDALANSEAAAFLDALFIATGGKDE